MNKKIKNTYKSKGKIQSKADEVPMYGYEEFKPAFRFTYTDKNKVKLSKWTNTELEELIEKFKQLEEQTWKQIRGNSGLNYHHTNHSQLKVDIPMNIPQDAKITYFRVCGVKRVFGFRDGHNYYLIWFDREKEVYP